MATEILTDLISDEFLLSLGVLTDARAAHKCLSRSSHVRDLRDSLKNGSVSEKAVREFVDRISKTFETGVQFFHEPALAAVAIAVANRGTNFAEDYLLDLARLHKRAEFSIAPAVAGICLGNRYQLAKQKISKPRLHSNPDDCLTSWQTKGFNVRKATEVRSTARTITHIEDLASNA